jgi:zinc transporter 1/2/3
LDYFNSFGGGVLLGISVLQMLSASEMTPSIDTDGIDKGFPIVHFIFLIGFFFTFFLEWCISRIREYELKKMNQMEESENYMNLRTLTEDDIMISRAVSEDDIGINPTVANMMESKDTLQPRSFILLSILVIESIITGITIGIQNAESNIYTLFFAVVSHDWIESMILTLSFWGLIQDMISKKKLIFISFCFSISTSIGIAIGIFIQDFIPLYTIQISSSIFLSFASGTFLYIATIKMLSRSIQATKFSLSCYLLAFVGFSLSSILLYFIR